MGSKERAASFARPRSVSPPPCSLNSRHQAARPPRHTRKKTAAGRGIGLQLIAQGSFHVAALMKAMFQAFCVAAIVTSCLAPAG